MIETRLFVLILLILILIWCIFPEIYTGAYNVVTYKDTENFETGSNPQSSQSGSQPAKYIASLGVNDYLDDGGDGNLGLIHSMCSKACCSAQYPPPFALDVDPMICNSKEQYVPSNYMCNNGWQDAGCVCMTKEQSENLARRGGNR